MSSFSFIIFKRYSKYLNSVSIDVSGNQLICAFHIMQQWKKSECSFSFEQIDRAYIAELWTEDCWEPLLGSEPGHTANCTVPAWLGLVG